ncbi:MAG: transglycosylase domain-containing protein, partial [Chloroflexota bacterium]
MQGQSGDPSQEHPSERFRRLLNAAGDDPDELPAAPGSLQAAPGDPQAAPLRPAAVPPDAPATPPPPAPPETRPATRFDTTAWDPQPGAPASPPPASPPPEAWKIPPSGAPPARPPQSSRPVEPPRYPPPAPPHPARPAPGSTQPGARGPVQPGPTRPGPTRPGPAWPGSPPPTEPGRPAQPLYAPPPAGRGYGGAAYPAPPARPVQPGRAAPPRRPPAGRTPWRARLGCLLRTVFIALFGGVLLGLCGVSILFFQYFRIARSLPDIEDLRSHASQFETTRIYDRNGDLLYEIVDPSAGRRTSVPLERISPELVAATIATEDQGYYSHPGFDVLAILRAFYQNYTQGETVSGASTITQQLARGLLFTPEERIEQSYSRKMREAILAAELTRRYSKDEILEIYLNEIYYGNLAYGIEAAAETYFNTTAGKLTLGQAAFLAGLPQAPA